MSRALLWLLALAAFVAFVGLGRWQWGRALEKEALLAQREQALIAPPRALATGLEGAAGVPALVAGQGEFPDVPAVLLDNQLRDGRVGVRVYRAFRPNDGAAPLLVDLGWMPLPADRSLPPTPSIEGPQQVCGLLIAPPSAGIALGEVVQPQPDGRLLVTRLDPAALAGRLGLPALASRVLRLDPALPIGYARDLDLLTNTLPPEKHRGYAIQWWGLATAVAAIALLLGLRRRHA